MFYIALAVILGLLIIAALGVAVFSPSATGADRYGRKAKTSKKPAAVTAASLTVLLVIVTLIFSATTVSPRAVGIQTSFGRYVSTLDNGFHWTAPWSGVEEFSTQVQARDLDDIPVSYAGQTTTDANGNTVSTGSGGSGNVDLTVRYTINADKAEALWKKYKSFENVEQNLVLSTAKETTRVVVGKRNPVEAKDGANLRVMTDEIVADLTTQLADDGIVIDSVSIRDVALDENAQRSLDQIVSANANTERAKAERERAAIDAETQAIRANSGLNTTEALQRYCLEVTNAWDVNKNGALPAGWTCAAGAPFVVTK